MSPDVQRGSKELLDPRQKRGAVDGAVQHQRGDDPVVPQAGQEGGGLPMPTRHPPDHPLAARRAAMEPCHVGLGPSFIQEDQATHV
jgi:hypothetical protein